MPFTVSHIAAILPLRKSILKNSYIALAIGSMMPDLFYFLPLAIGRSEGHSLKALFIYCLPMGVLFTYLFKLILKEPLIALLPHQINSKVEITKESTLSIKHLLITALAVFIGALTHLVWDLFTHAGSWITGNFPFFAIRLFKIENYSFYIYSALQHSSTLLGIIILMISFYRWFCKEEASHRDQFWSAKIKLLINLALILPPFLLSIFWSFYTPLQLNLFSRFYRFVQFLVFDGGKIYLAAVFIYCFSWQIVKIKALGKIRSI